MIACHNMPLFCYLDSHTLNAIGALCTEKYSAHSCTKPLLAEFVEYFTQLYPGVKNLPVSMAEVERLMKQRSRSSSVNTR